MSHSKKDYEQSNSSKFNSDDEESTSGDNEDAAEKTDEEKDSDDCDCDCDASSNDSFWPNKKQDATPSDPEKQKEIIKASRKRFREEVCKVIQKMSPSLSSLLTDPFHSDESNTAADGEKEEEENKEEGEDESNVVPQKKQKK